MWLTRAIADRASLLWCRVSERAGYGRVSEMPTSDGPVLVVLDGVGRFQFAPYAIRSVLRQLKSPIETVMYDWQFGLVGEIWTDLCWLRRNRLMGARLARLLRRIHRQRPDRPIHVFAFSGGAGIAVFACERLGGRRMVDTLVLAAPALSPGYDLRSALRGVERCVVLVSPRDRLVLGVGTSLFGTTDRKFGKSAGQVGFEGMNDLHRVPSPGYDRCRQIRWDASLRGDGHFGGHAGWIAPPFLRRYLPGLLGGDVVWWTEKGSTEQES